MPTKPTQSPSNKPTRKPRKPYKQPTATCSVCGFVGSTSGIARYHGPDKCKLRPENIKLLSRKEREQKVKQAQTPYESRGEPRLAKEKAKAKRDKQHAKPPPVDVTSRVNKIIHDTPDLFTHISDKAETVMEEIISSLDIAGVLSCSPSDAKILIIENLVGIEASLLQYSRNIHIKNLREAFKQTSNSGLSKQISDLMSYENAMEDLEVFCVHFGELEYWNSAEKIPVD